MNDAAPAYQTAKYKNDPAARYYRHQERLEQHVRALQEGNDGGFMNDIPSDRDSDEDFAEDVIDNYFPFNVKPRHSVDDINWGVVPLPNITIAVPSIALPRGNPNGSLPFWLRDARARPPAPQTSCLARSASTAR